MITIKPGEVSLETLTKIYRGHCPMTLDPACYKAVAASRDAVNNMIRSGESVYGINTGFGRLAQTSVPDDKLEALQRNLVLSHGVGTGDRLDDAVVRLALVLKVNSLARGYSGVRAEVIDTLLALYNHEIYPCVPSQGSVGASGDLAPLAHLSLALIGEGEARVEGEIVLAIKAMRKRGISPLTLQAKEGLAVLNGTQVSTALALAALFDARRAFTSAVIAGAMTTDAALASYSPFEERIHLARGQQGQIKAAALYRRVLDDSEINRSHADCEKVQDPYSLRCQPQVMGACLDQMEHVAQVLLVEANAVSDNPLVFADSGEAVSGGNFHAEPVAFAADNLALVIAEIGALSERRIALLIDATISELPPFLVEDPGLHCGFMIAHVTAAALTSENKSLAHPASVDSLPTSANQEDHVSMATYAAYRLQHMNRNTNGIVAIELLAAAQGIDFRRPLTSTSCIEKAHGAIRARIAHWSEDRFFAPDLEFVKQLIADGTFEDLAPSVWEQR